MTHEKNEVLEKKFAGYYPAGHTNFKVKKGDRRIFITSAKGAHLTDVDGNDYIEYNGALGPTILGYGHPEYVKALAEHMEVMPTLAASNKFFTEGDIELAERIVKHVPCAEEVKLCMSGSEAVQMAMRIARAYTGKSIVIRFSGNYHGWLDNVLGSVADEGAEVPYPGPVPTDDMCYSIGKSPNSKYDCYVLPWNDMEALEECFEKYHDEIAMVHFEGCVCNHLCLYPKEGFVEKIRELCTKYHAVMSMDEVITGFRVGLSGMQGILGVTPDICTMAKAIAGGMPLSAVAGKKEIMDVFREKSVLGPGTFNGYALGITAANTTIRILEENDGEIYKKIDAVKEKLVTGILEICEKYGVDIRITEMPGAFFTLIGAKGGRKKAFTDEDTKGFDTDKFLKFKDEMEEEGIVLMGGGRWYIGGGHTLEDAEKTLVAFEKCLKKVYL